MTNPTIFEHNVETGEAVEREMTAAEFEAFEATKIESAARQQELADALIKKQAVLDKLGITADELAAALA